MRDFEEIIPIVFAIAVAIALFFGLIHGLKKVMNLPAKQGTINSRDDLKAQKRRMEDIQRRQRQLMDDQRQRIKDLRRL